MRFTLSPNRRSLNLKTSGIFTLVRKRAMSVKFLLRFDDICPTMDWKIWNEVETILVEEGIKPILAVIPDNQDETLHDAEPNRHFWDRVRSWQTRGWTIGLHGYQ